MNVNTTSSSTNTSAATSKGLSGLMSGMDTDAMVEALLSGTQSKIDSQNALLKQTTWKQEIYRDLISDINSFKNKYFDILASSSLLDSATFAAMSASSSSGAVSAIASAYADAGSYKIDVAQLASATSIFSSAPVSGNLYASFNASAFNRNVKFDITDADGNVTESVAVDLSGLKTNDEIVSALRLAFADKAEISLDDGAVSITAAEGSKISVNSQSGETGLKMLGVSAGTASAALTGKLNAAASAELKVTFDGIEKTVKLSDDDLLGSLQSGLDKAFGTGTITMTARADGTYSFETASSGHSLSVSGDSTALKALGFSSARSNVLSLNTEVKNLSFASELVGDKFEFTINGVDFSFSSSETLANIILEINESDAGVKISYDAMNDAFKMERTETGKGFGIEMSQKTGNLLTAMFSVNNADSYTSGALVTNSISGSALNAADTFEEGVFKIVVNGREYSFSIPRKTTTPAEYTGEEIVNELNKQLLSAFGKGENGEAALKLAADGTLKINSRLSVSFNSETDGNLNTALGLTNANNAAGAQSSVSDIFGIDTAYLSEAQKSGTLADLLGGSGAVINDDGSVTATDSFTDAALQHAVFGTALAFGNGADSGAGYTVTEGKNAVFAVNGVVTERSSNSFENNGITFTFNSVTDSTLSAEYDSAGKLTGISGLDSASGSASVTTSKNLDKVMETIKSFVNDYNTLIGKLNDKISEERTYKKYAPLTDAQKKEMSDREIELWEEKAKTGLLANDSTISAFLSDMRSILYTKSESAGIALYDIGIDTGSYTDKGKLVINETELRSALETKGDEIAKLFTGSDGISKQLSTVIDSVAKISSGSPGTLVSLAGTSTTLKETNTLTERISSINDKITQLKSQYETEKNRYWTQFNTMEKLLSDLNSQSSWLTSMFS